VAGAASSQEQLAVAAQNAVATIVQLSDVVKAGAASLGSQNQEAQVSSTSFVVFFFKEYVHNLKGNFLDFFFFYVLYSTLLHLPPLRLTCVGGCWDRTRDSCDYGIDCQTL
jgi:hypothetical protein